MCVWLEWVVKLVGGGLREGRISAGCCFVVWYDPVVVECKRAATSRERRQLKAVD